MPALKPTDIYATIDWLGYVPHRDAKELETHPLETMALDFGGYGDDCHAGVTRPSCSRVVAQHPKGTPISNVRQLSIVSTEELQIIADSLGIDRFDPKWAGASVVLSGIADFSHIPPSSRLQADSGATLTIDMQNRPCHFPALTIEADLPGRGKGFKEAAEGKRGVTAWVERPGLLSLGDRLRLHVPDQRGWHGAGA